jgi:hypothetical protein
MSQPVHPLSLQELLQLIRYELHISREEMANECGLCPCCYEDLEQCGDPEMEPSLVAAIHEQLPRLSTLLQLRRRKTGGESFADRLAALEGRTPTERALDLQRIRLELQWLDAPPA